jgi:hypothetical protein
MTNTAWQNGRRAVGKVGLAEALIIDVDGKRAARDHDLPRLPAPLGGYLIAAVDV